MSRRALFCGAMALLLAGCGGESHQDLRAWMQEQGKGVKGKLDPLPQVKPYEPFTYNAFDLPDPFKPRKIEPLKGGSKLAPDLNRRKEPLEAYPLESLQMVGTLQRGKNTYALVRTTGQGYLSGQGRQLHGPEFRRRSSTSTTAKSGSRNSCRTAQATGPSDRARSSSPRQNNDRERRK